MSRQAGVFPRPRHGSSFFAPNMNNSRPSRTAAEDVSTLRMSPMEIERLKRELESSTSAAGAAKRTFKRWPFECRAIKMEIQHPGGAATVLHYVPRNVSREGMGLLHSSFVYPGTRCTAFLPHPTRGLVPIAGAVVRCRHFRGKVHELGVRFDQPIDVRDFLGLDGTEGCYMLENVVPDTLTGGVLLIEPGEMDRALIRQHLKDTNLTVTATETAADGLARAAEGYDVILCSLALPDGDGLDLLFALRAAGIQSPFLLLCSSAGAEPAKERIRVLRPEGVVCKPVPAQTLLSAIGEFLLVRSKDLGGGGAAIFSSLGPHDPLAAHIPEFLGELRQLAQRVNTALGKSDAAECARLVFQIKGAAPTFGFGSLAEAAEQADGAIRASQSVSESSAAIRKLLGMCYRAQARRKAA